MLVLYHNRRMCKKTIVPSNSPDIKLVDYNMWQILLEEVLFCFVIVLLLSLLLFVVFIVLC